VLTSKKFCSFLLENHGGEEVKTTALTAQESCSLSPIEALTQRVSGCSQSLPAKGSEMFHGRPQATDGKQATSQPLPVGEAPADYLQGWSSWSWCTTGQLTITSWCKTPYTASEGEPHFEARAYDKSSSRSFCIT